ncbi:MAG: RNA methyltransferase [Syntrophomonadaceae bacterium]|nr:RNA methyltransferase [Syntrophomonadaceae bacterium]
MQIITSSDNRHLKLARKLKQHKFRQRENRFLLEGKVPVKEALSKHGDLVETIFVTARQADWLARQPHDATGAWQIDEREMVRLCDTTTPQGVIAVVRHPGYDLAAIMSEPGLLLYLEEIGDPGNVGSIIRSAQAMEVGAVLLSPGCADAFSSKVIRSSMGSMA